MLHNLHQAASTALLPRLTLLINHVLGSETVATTRLQAHAGRSLALAFDGWPALLPPPPGPLFFRVTPAGLLEWCPDEAAAGSVADLRLRLDCSQPTRWLAQGRQAWASLVSVEGDAALAGELNWLAQNLRWDVAADLQQLAGPLLAQQFQDLAAVLAAGLKRAVAWGEGLRRGAP